MALADRFTVEPIWKGCTVAVIGGGASLSTRQSRAIAIAKHRAGSNLRVIAVNDAIWPFWFADWHHAGDGQWWRWHIQSCHTFPGIKTTIAEDVPRPWVNGYLRNTGDVGFDPDPSSCRTGGSSAYQAMCIAIHAGAARIILVGLDMHGDHFFGDHPDRVKTNFVQSMLPRFETIVPTLKERGVEVVNATPGSRLGIFPEIDFERAFAA